jgi:hypothetical protein
MATVADIAQLRRRIGDTIRENTEQFSGDSSNNAYNFRYSNIQTITVTLDGAPLVQNTDYTLDPRTGIITVSKQVTSNNILAATYTYGAYTDIELGNTLDQAGSLLRAILECLYELQAGAARFYDYTQGQTRTQKSQVFKNLTTMIDQYKKEGAELESVFPGGDVRMRTRRNSNYNNRRWQGRDITRFG